jgi:transcriptional repressor NrdR
VHCPFCNHEDTKVTDSRLAGEGHQIRRRRECLACGERFTTFETAELVMPQVVKTDRTRQPFDEVKLRAGIMKALEKRPVGRDDVESALERIAHRLRGLGEREVASRTIGEIVMEELRQLDEVAYVRYASVYHQFHDVDAFREQIDQLDRSRQRDSAAGQMSLLPPHGRDTRHKR